MIHSITYTKQKLGRRWGLSDQAIEGGIAQFSVNKSDENIARQVNATRVYIPCLFSVACHPFVLTDSSPTSSRRFQFHLTSLKKKFHSNNCIRNEFYSNSRCKILSCFER